jgi:Ca-activated chloride channel homolog
MWKLRLLCIFITERLNAFHLIPTIKIKKSVMKMNRFILGAIGALWFSACYRETAHTKMEAPKAMSVPPSQDMMAKSAEAAPASMGKKEYREVEANTEDYKHIVDNNFKKTTQEPVSTFSIDVDKASYSNVRRFIESGKLPPADAVRVEELINYFDYNYPQPTAQHPLSITTDLTECFWKKGHYLLHVGLKGREYEVGQAPPMNLVFLIDVSGSMDEPNKLPLLKSAFELLINQLRPQDRVAMVVYAGNAGMVLPSTSGAEKSKILAAFNKLQAGGSTAGGEGIELAYKIAQQNFIASGNNRVILATDGDFNVGVSSDGELTRLIEQKRKTNIFLSVMGFGMGNYKDSKLEAIAQNGNGNYAYIDNLSEAKRVLGSEMTGTLFTIAKDVKLQIEFNPTLVESYRLIGYENRLLNREDFNNDAKDAGDLGAGQTVTALYEIVPAKGQTLQTTDDLKYQQSQPTAHAQNSNEWVHIKFRYKQPKQNKSLLLEQSVAGKPQSWQSASENVRFASAVAGYGMMLRQSAHKGDCTYQQVLETATAARGDDAKGYRAAFIEMVQKTQKLK